MDTKVFADSWEQKYGEIHDPLPLEVVSRVEMILKSKTMGSVCEIGAGYGRIINLISDEFRRIAVEPDVYLFNILSANRDLYCVNVDLNNLAKLQPVDLFYTVRCLEYASLVQIAKFLYYLKRNQKQSITLVYERKMTVQRVRWARRIVGFNRVYVCELFG